jgi:hypothetical protein
MPDCDELLALANQRATQEALQLIKNDIEDNTQSYYEWIAAGRYRDAGIALRNAHALADEATRIVGAVQQQQAQAQQRQSRYTEMEQELLRDYPQIVRDPKKWQTALVAANNLIMRGYDRNSPEYAQAIAHACDVLNADLTESNEVASPDTALATCQSKYGPTTVEEYNNNVRILAARKAAGMYPNSQ